jgi:predicted nucleotidyltransferase
MTDLNHIEKRAAGSLNQLLNWYLNESHGNSPDQPWLTSSLIPGGLADFNSLLAQSAAPTTPQSLLEFSPIANESWYSTDSWFKETIDQLASILESNRTHEILGETILHGSMADGRYSKGWSDFDIFAVVPNSTLSNREQLFDLREQALEVRRILNQQMPLQHHGIQFVAESTLNWFNESALPISALTTGKSLRSDTATLTIHSYFDRASSIRNLEARKQLFKHADESGEMLHHPHNGVFLKDSYQNANNALFQFKYLLDVCTLAPAVAIAATGFPTDKASALKKLESDLPEAAWKIINSATEVRSQWSTREGFGRSDNEVPNWVQNIVGPDYFADALRLFDACLKYVDIKGAK